MPRPRPEPDDPRDARVVVTGLGLITGLGETAPECWRNLRDGRHAFQALAFPVAEGSLPYVGAPTRRPHRGAPALAVRAAVEAVADAGLFNRRAGRWVGVDPSRVATAVGMSKGDVKRLARVAAGRLAGWRRGWPDAANAAIARFLGVEGPYLGPVAACATGLVAAVQAADLVRRGVCDVALAGAADASLDPLMLGAFRRMGALARWVDGEDPARSVRPWDVRRSGFLIGEGAAVLVLERESRARARGALPYAEFAGGALGADAHHMTDLDPDPANLAALIGRALADSNVDPSEIDHVNVHGTATRSNDPLECRALWEVFGARASEISCSASKAQVGHCLGAAGAVELALTTLALRDAFIPPTLNLDHPDPACDLDGTPHVGRSRAIRAALKLSLGFGGHLAAAVLGLADGPRRASEIHSSLETSTTKS